MADDATSRTVQNVLDLPGFPVLAAAEYGGELELLVETTATAVHCVRCGRRAFAQGGREHLLRDVPVGDRPTVLVWAKRTWRCRNRACPMVSWTLSGARDRPGRLHPGHLVALRRLQRRRDYRFYPGRPARRSPPQPRPDPRPRRWCRHVRRPYAGFGLAGASIAVLALPFIAAGIGIGAVETAEHAAVAALAPETMRGSAFGLLATIQALGNVAASVVAGILCTAASRARRSPTSPTG